MSRHRTLARYVGVACAVVILAGACRRDVVEAPPADTAPIPAQLQLPWGVADSLGWPAMPADNPLTVEGIALGRKLFHEKALSDDWSMSCASCHVQANAFTDPLPFSVGTDGSIGTWTCP